ncbi:hypothetical protein KM043_010193 [Ampulex compressa]|nr:hypothetical protein KM043_010193 [Ampulex compressa]
MESPGPCLHEEVRSTKRQDFDRAIVSREEEQESITMLAKMRGSAPKFWRVVILYAIRWEEFVEYIQHRFSTVHSVEESVQEGYYVAGNIPKFSSGRGVKREGSSAPMRITAGL